jgi:xanthine dehydrogenase small subunit
MTEPIQFYLNDQETVACEPPETLVLDFLRDSRRLTGTKEGCREGDCGACVVLVGELQDDRVRYRAVTSCLMPIAQLQGKHLVTIEGLNLAQPSVVQQAIVDEGASQCGFCTPGIVVSLTGLMMEEGRPVTVTGVKEALGGHLCRCTGYRSLKACTRHLHESFSEGDDVASLVSKGLLPGYFSEIPARLRSIACQPSRNGHAPSEYLIAGGTDVYVQTDGIFPAGEVTILDGRPEMEGIVARDDAVDVGALTTFEELAHHPAITEIVPDIGAYMHLIASVQIRNRATVGGNLVNASPIGDITILMLALGARVELRSEANSRTVDLDSFYHGYKQLDKSRDEVVTRIHIPRPARGTRINWEKVSKRKCLDIASVNSAIRIRDNGEEIVEAVLSAGGVAPVPLVLHKTGEHLRGKPLSTVTIADACDVAQQEITPITDVRGSAAYKRLLVRQLILAHFTRLYPDRFKLEEFYEPV